MGGHFVFVTKISLNFWNQPEIFSIFDTRYDLLFQGKKIIQLSKGPFFKFLDTKTGKRLKHHKINKYVFSKIVSNIFRKSKTTWSNVNFKNHWILLYILREGGGASGRAPLCMPWSPPNHTRQELLRHKSSVKLQHVAGIVRHSCLCLWAVVGKLIYKVVSGVALLPLLVKETCYF